MNLGLGMNRNQTHHRRRIAILCLTLCMVMSGLTGRLIFLMVFRSSYYSQKAEDLHQRERTIKAARGRIMDRNGVVLADNRTVCTVSVIHNQVEDTEQVTTVLSELLAMPQEEIRKKVEKYSSREIIRTNVDKETGDQIRQQHLAGVKVDEDYKRYYPYDSLASKVLGFTGGDNQGIIGLEVKYENWLKGRNGKILTMTDAAGVELENAFEDREEPVPGYDLTISLDYNIQAYAEQLADRTLEAKGAKRVSIIVMNPQNGELLAMVNAPEYNLNTPYELNIEITEEDSSKSKMDLLNMMWRNFCINDTYEPGSVFKMVTATAALETGVAHLSDSYTCGGNTKVGDRTIRCHKTTGHGTQTFTETVMNRSVSVRKNKIKSGGRNLSKKVKLCLVFLNFRIILSIARK